MLAMRLVRLIETHADQLSHGITQRLEHDPHCADLRKVPMQELEGREVQQQAAENLKELSRKSASIWKLPRLFGKDKQKREE